MDLIKNEIKSIIDEAFGYNKKVFGNTFADKLKISNELDKVIDLALDNCLTHLNNNYPLEAKEFANTGFINDYIKQKQIEYLLG